MNPTWWSSSLLFLLACACSTPADCERRMEAARRDAVRDAEACRFEPDGVPLERCGTNDFRPRNNWLSVWCGLADLSCIRGIPAAEVACFGGPDTGLLGAP